MSNNRICNLFNIKYPIIAGGMVWCSGWRLAVGVSNAGGLGLIGAGSMHPETLLEHICKAQQATTKPFGVNIPLFYPELDKILKIVIDEKIPIVFTSAGSPKKLTTFLHKHNITVAHVVSSAEFAIKSEDAGVDAIVAEGFEAGGHNGRDETTTMALMPSVRKVTKLPLLAAGGIGSGQAMLAAMALGAEGVQIGSLFATSEESSAHINFKRCILRLKEGDTFLSLKKVSPVRLVCNNFFRLIKEAEDRGATTEELSTLLGHGKSKKGIFEGDIDNGELEIGQVSSMIDSIKPVDLQIKTLLNEYEQCLRNLNNQRDFLNNDDSI